MHALGSALFHTLAWRRPHGVPLPLLPLKQVRVDKFVTRPKYYLPNNPVIIQVITLLLPYTT